MNKINWKFYKKNKLSINKSNNNEFIYKKFKFSLKVIILLYIFIIEKYKIYIKKIFENQRKYKTK